MKAFRCDRCCAYEDGEPVAGVTFNLPVPDAAPGSSARRSRGYELCSPCLASLQDWLDEPRGVDPEAA
jgi:hypothetical protein